MIVFFQACLRVVSDVVALRSPIRPRGARRSKKWPLAGSRLRDDRWVHVWIPP